MISQHTKYDKNYNLKEYTEKDSEGNIMYALKYNKNNQLIFVQADDGWEKKTYDKINKYYPIKVVHSSGLIQKYEYDEFGNEIGHWDNKGYWHKNNYHEPIILLGRLLIGSPHRPKVRYNWLQSHFKSDGTKVYYDFFGRKILEINPNKTYIKTVYGENNACTIFDNTGEIPLIFQSYSLKNIDESLLEYWNTHMVNYHDYVHICVHEVLESLKPIPKPNGEHLIFV